MAAVLGVSKSQVARDAAAGMPMHDVDAARAWRLANHDISRTVEGRIDRPGPLRPGSTAPPPLAQPGIVEAPPSAEVDKPPAAIPPGDENTAAYREHRAAFEKTRSERAQLELDQLRGRLIELEEAKRLAFTAFRTLRDAVLNVPARIKDQCAAETDAFLVEQLIETELTLALETFEPAKLMQESDDDETD